MQPNAMYQQFYFENYEKFKFIRVFSLMFFQPYNTVMVYLSSYIHASIPQKKSKAESFFSLFGNYIYTMYYCSQQYHTGAKGFMKQHCNYHIKYPSDVTRIFLKFFMIVESDSNKVFKLCIKSPFIGGGWFLKSPKSTLRNTKMVPYLNFKMRLHKGYD